MTKKQQRSEELARREGFLTPRQATLRKKELEDEQDARIAAEVKIIRQRTKDQAE